MADQAAHNGNGTNGYYLNIEDYYDQIHRTTWARRTAGMLGGATLGAIYGGAVGAIAAFIPHILSALGVAGAATAVLPALSLGTIAASVALFAGATAFIGMLVTADVAANAASSAVGLEEKERREKISQLNGNGKSLLPDQIEAAVQPEKEKKEKVSVKGPPLFSWKVGLVASALFAAFGALIAFNPYTSAMLFKEAFPGLTGAAAVTASTVTFGMFGVFMGMKSSLLTNKLSNFYYDLVTERLFNKAPQKEAAKETQAEMLPPREQAVELAMAEPNPRKAFAVETTRFSLHALIEKSDEPQETAMLR